MHALSSIRVLFCTIFILMGLLGLSRCEKSEPSDDTSTPLVSIPRNGLVGEWLFSGNANDTSGNSNNGVSTGAVLMADRFGYANSAYYFPDSTTYISVPDNSTLWFTSVTVSCWIYVPSTSVFATAIGMPLTKGGSNGNPMFNIYYFSDTNKFRFDVGTGVVSSDGIAPDSDGVSRNTWVHFVGTYDGATIKLYLNGVLNKSYNYSTGLNTNNGMNLTFGQRNYAPYLPGDNNFPFKGCLDDVRIYNRVLTDSEITALYNE